MDQVELRAAWRAWCLCCHEEYELKEKTEAIAVAKVAGIRSKYEKILQRNTECEKKLSVQLGETSVDSNKVMFSNCTSAHFNSCNTKDLQAFIHVRQFDSYNKDQDWKWPTKQGLVDLAYERRSLPIKLKIPTNEATNQASQQPIQPIVEPTVVH